MTVCPASTSSKVKVPNEPVTAVRLMPCESVSVTMTFRMAIPDGDRTRPEMDAEDATVFDNRYSQTGL